MPRRARHGAWGGDGATLSARGACVQRQRRPVQAPDMSELDLDLSAGAASLDHAIEHATVARDDIRRRRARGLLRRWVREDAGDISSGAWQFERASAKRIELREIRVRHGGGSGLDGRISRVLGERIREDAVLHRAKTHDRQRSDADEDRRDHQRLTALAAHGVHSIRRDALAVTTRRGSPTNPSGTGSV